MKELSIILNYFNTGFGDGDCDGDGDGDGNGDGSRGGRIIVKTDGQYTRTKYGKVDSSHLSFPRRCR